MSNNRTPLENFLHHYDDADWNGVLQELLPAIHPVDANATQIWFKFWPYDLLSALDNAPDRALLEKRLLLQGKFYLKDQIDTSHVFLYGHRYWPQVKAAIAAYHEQATGSLAHLIRSVAAQVAKAAQEEDSLLVGITAVGFMTLQHVGLAAFKATPGLVAKQHFSLNSPGRVIRERAQDDSQGLLGFLRTVDKQWTVRYDENAANGCFKLMHEEELASGAARDQSQDWVAQDARRGEGPIPVECRSAACGTCWVGILGGAEKLSPVAELEGRRVKLFGYANTDEAQPLIRLACMARARGAVSLVIPPWNGVYAKYMRQIKSGAILEEETAAAT